MNSPFAFETDSFEFESQFEDSFEMFDTEFEDMEFEDEFRQRGRRGGSARPSSSRRRMPQRGRSQGRMRQSFPRRPPQGRRRRPQRFPYPVPYASGSAINFPPASADSERVRWVQSTLNRILGLNLPVDGVMSVETRSAIRSFQKQKGLPVDGIVGPPTERALIDAGAEQPAADTASSGDTGSDTGGDAGSEGQELFEFEDFEDYYIEAEDYEMEDEVNRQSREYGKWVQQALNKILGLRLAVDGIIGTQTKSAIRSFQQRQGLAADGIVGPQTEGALIRAGAGNSPQSSGTTPSYPSGGGTSTGGLDIVNVRGIQVARQISSQVNAMLAAAEADGIRLGGGGFRSPDQQIALRKKNCGPTHYDIYEKPSSQCTPMTARPGSSNHERGLAIDFTYNGQSITSQSSPAFKWLAANAARFGLYNLPKEPWHWSVDGK